MRVITLVLVAAVVVPPSARAAADGPVALVVNTDDGAFSWERVQRAVVEAVGAPVVATDDPNAGGRRGLLTVTWRPSRRELAVTYENPRGVISRIVPTPDDAGAAVATAAVMAANLVRDQAAELLGGPGTVAEPAPPAPPPATWVPAPLPRFDDEDRPAVMASAPPPEITSRWSVGVSIGTGAGWASGRGETTGELVKPGLAPTNLGFIAPQVGYLLRPRLMLSLAIRYQVITATNDLHLAPELSRECGGDGVCTGPRSAFAAFGRATLFGAPPARALRPYVSFALGAGEIRYPMTFRSVSLCGPKANSSCVDTVLAGPVFGGLGGGLHYRVVGPVDVVAGLEVLLASGLTFNIDASLGAALSF